MISIKLPSVTARIWQEAVYHLGTRDFIKEMYLQKKILNSFQALQKMSLLDPLPENKWWICGRILRHIGKIYWVASNTSVLVLQKTVMDGFIIHKFLLFEFHFNKRLSPSFLS